MCNVRDATQDTADSGDVQTDCIEGFYGGAARGGKSDCLLMACLQFVDIPDYSALILRRTFADLSLPKALMDRSMEWLKPTDAKWLELKKTWTFPSGATITFGYLDHSKAKYRYQGSEFSTVAYDELTQFKLDDYTYLSSRLCRIEGTDLPLRLLSASNPGNDGHEWVKQRFIDPSPEEMEAEGKVFVPAMLEDNPFVDQGAYMASLRRLNPITREQLRYGNWDVANVGGIFDRTWFNIVQNAPQGLRMVRFWDLAGTEVSDRNKDPDFTAGCLMGYSVQEDRFYVLDMQHIRKQAHDVQALILQCAKQDGLATKIRIEQEPGSAGKGIIAGYKELLQGYNFVGEKPSGSKVARAHNLSVECANGNVSILAGPWNSDFLNELEKFPSAGVHDDQVDAISGAFNILDPGKRKQELHQQFKDRSGSPVKVGQKSMMGPVKGRKAWI